MAVHRVSHLGVQFGFGFSLREDRFTKCARAVTTLRLLLDDKNNLAHDVPPMPWGKEVYQLAHASLRS